LLWEQTHDDEIDIMAKSDAERQTDLRARRKARILITAPVPLHSLDLKLLNDAGVLIGADVRDRKIVGAAVAKYLELHRLYRRRYG
jgi:hypothetical protein